MIAINTLFKNKEYPPPQRGIYSLMVSIGLGAFITFFLLFFKPFNIDASGHSSWEISFFGVIAALTAFLFHNLSPVLFPKIFREGKWYISSQIFFDALQLLVLATLNGIYLNYIEKLNFCWPNYFEIIIDTFVLGLIPLVFLVQLNLWRKHKKVEMYQDSNPHESNVGDPIQASTFSVKTNLKGAFFDLDEENFLFAKSDGNYIEIHREDGAVSVERLSLKDFENQIDSKSIIRCHRSYLVNLKKVSNYTGNAQGLKLRLSHGQSLIPVSRKFVEEIRSSLG